MGETRLSFIKYSFSNFREKALFPYRIPAITCPVTMRWAKLRLLCHAFPVKCTSVRRLHRILDDTAFVTWYIRYTEIEICGAFCWKLSKYLWSLRVWYWYYIVTQKPAPFLSNNKAHKGRRVALWTGTLKDMLLLFWYIWTKNFNATYLMLIPPLILLHTLNYSFFLTSTAFDTSFVSNYRCLHFHLCYSLFWSRRAFF